MLRLRTLMKTTSPIGLEKKNRARRKGLTIREDHRRQLADAERLQSNLTECTDVESASLVGSSQEHGNCISRAARL